MKEALLFNENRGDYMGAEEKAQSRFHEDAVAMLERFKLMDDDFFSEALDGKIDAVQFILNTVLERDDLKVIETKTQREYKSATKRSIKLDIWAQDEEGRITDVEIQRADKGTGAKRARIHSSMIDRDLLEKGQEFDEVAETYVIFITENDKYDAGLPVYHINRTIEELNHRSFEDESHIVYVNGAFRDKSHPIGRLMHDFWCTSADDMLNDVLAKEVRYMKESEEGRTSMCEMMEKMMKKVENNAKLEQLYILVQKGRLSLADAAEETGQTVDEFKAGMDAYYAQLASA